MTRRFWQLSLIGMILLAPLGATQACQICVPYPKRSAADELIDSETVVFAREDAKNPFSYGVIETLKGDATDADIDLLVDSATRKHLNGNPNECLSGNRAALGLTGAGAHSAH